MLIPIEKPYLLSKFLIKKNKENIALIEKSTITIYVSFHVLHVCIAFQQSRRNNKKLQVLIIN